MINGFRSRRSFLPIVSQPGFLIAAPALVRSKLIIRQKCVSRREEDDDPVNNPFAYTDLLDLWKIADDQWKIVGDKLPKVATADKRALKKDIERLNHIRKLVMHPVRGTPTEDEFVFVRSLKRRLAL